MKLKDSLDNTNTLSFLEAEFEYTSKQKAFKGYKQNKRVKLHVTRYNNSKVKRT